MMPYHPSTVQLACWSRSICSLRASRMLQSSLALPSKSFLALGLSQSVSTTIFAETGPCFGFFVSSCTSSCALAFHYAHNCSAISVVRSITSAKPRATLNQALNILSCYNDKKLFFPSGGRWTTPPDGLTPFAARRKRPVWFDSVKSSRVLPPHDQIALSIMPVSNPRASRDGTGP